MIGKEIEPYTKITPENLEEHIGGYFLLLDYTDKVTAGDDFRNKGTFFVGKC